MEFLAINLIDHLELGDNTEIEIPAETQIGSQKMGRLVASGRLACAASGIIMTLHLLHIPLISHF